MNKKSLLRYLVNIAYVLAIGLCLNNNVMAMIEGHEKIKLIAEKLGIDTNANHFPESYYSDSYKSGSWIHSESIPSFVTVVKFLIKGVVVTIILCVVAANMYGVIVDAPMLTSDAVYQENATTISIVNDKQSVSGIKVTQISIKDVISCIGMGLPNKYTDYFKKFSDAQIPFIRQLLNLKPLVLDKSNPIHQILANIGLKLYQYNGLMQGPFYILNLVGINPHSPEAQAAIQYCRELIRYPN